MRQHLEGMYHLDATIAYIVVITVWEPAFLPNRHEAMRQAWENCHSVGVNTNCKSCFFEARKLCFFLINFFKFL